MNFYTVTKNRVFPGATFTMICSENNLLHIEPFGGKLGPAVSNELIVSNDVRWVSPTFAQYSVITIVRASVRQDSQGLMLVPAVNVKDYDEEVSAAVYFPGEGLKFDLLGRRTLMISDGLFQLRIGRQIMVNDKRNTPISYWVSFDGEHITIDGEPFLSKLVAA